MPVTYKNGNAVSALIDGEIDLLIHVCNDLHKMGSGIALEIKNRIADAYTAYKQRPSNLGTISFGWSNPNRGMVCNMVAQSGYGKGIRHLNYAALADCLNKISKGVSVKTIGLPFKLGADRAGGDWEIVLELIEYFLKDFNVVIYKLEG